MLLHLILHLLLFILQNVAVFSYEAEEFGCDGQRKYLVTTYYEFGQKYLYVYVL